MRNIVANWCGRWIASAVVGAAAVSAFVFPAAEAFLCFSTEAFSYNIRKGLSH